MDRKIINKNGDVSAVILNWNCSEILKLNLPRLLVDLNFRQIIVVDQASTDGTEALLAGYPDVTHIRNPVNLGSGKGRNVGLKHALSDEETGFVYSMDADIVVPWNLGDRFREVLNKFNDLHLIGASHPDCQTTDLTKVDEQVPEINGYFYLTMLSLTWCGMQKRLFYDKLLQCYPTWWNEEGPFGQPGWGTDDNDFAFRACKAGCNLGGVADVTWPDGKKRPPLIYHVDHRCFQDLYKETGVWPNQHNTTYERRVVLLYMDWAANYGTKVDTVFILLHTGNLATIKKKILEIHGRPEYNGQDYGHRNYRIVLPDRGDPEVKMWMWDKGCRWTPSDPDANWAIRPIDGGYKEAIYYAGFYHPQARIIEERVY